MATKKTGTELALWDKQLAEDAAAAAKAVASLGGGQFFSIRGGTLSLGDAKMPGNEMVIIALDSVFENVFYEGEYDPENSSGPSCYAFGREQSAMEPHPDADKKVSEGCATCPNNAWGSAAKGKGKACKNRVRIACISGGMFNAGRFEPTDAETVANAQIAYLGVPPTSLGAWAQYVKGVVATQKRAPYAVFTRVKLVPDPKTQVRLEFELVGKVEADIGPAVIAKRDEAKASIIFPFPKREAAPKGPAKKRKF